jgi:hypothetical protein
LLFLGKVQENKVFSFFRSFGEWKTKWKSKDEKMQTTFTVVEGLALGKPLEVLDPVEDLRQSWIAQAKSMGLEGGIQGASAPPKGNVVKVFGKNSCLAAMVHTAFYKHKPMVLTPDAIWITIAQGFGHHIEKNPEKFRKEFGITFEGKRDLVVNRPGFVWGSPDNTWEDVFPEFAHKIGVNTSPELVQLMECDFTTSAPTDIMASQITLMSTCRHYFNYLMRMGCGFPSITLTGTPDDWVRLRAKAEQLTRFGLKWWTDELLLVLDEFVHASTGEVNKDFWSAMCNFAGASGKKGAPITGWLQVFYPYLTQNASPKMHKNRYLGQYRKEMDSVGRWNFRKGVRLSDIPSSMAAAPVKIEDLATGEIHDVQFVAGISCVTEDPETGTLTPHTGWAVLS